MSHSSFSSPSPKWNRTVVFHDSPDVCRYYIYRYRRVPLATTILSGNVRTLIEKIVQQNRTLLAVSFPSIFPRVIASYGALTSARRTKTPPVCTTSNDREAPTQSERLFENKATRRVYDSQAPPCRACALKHRDSLAFMGTMPVFPLC